MIHSRTLDYLQKLKQLCSDIGIFIEGMDKIEFLADKRTQNAVAMSLIAMGEIVTVLTHKDPDFIDKNPTIPWRYMKGMRNIIAHGYFELDYEIVWETAVQSIPELLFQLEKILNTLTD